MDRVCFIVGDGSPSGETGTALQNPGVQHVQSLVLPGAGQAAEGNTENESIGIVHSIVFSLFIV